jgi:hypothetical protein
MFELRPDADRPAIAGKSTRNTRIERWWFEPNSTITPRFLNLFEILRSEGLLNDRYHEDWAIDGYILRRVFMWRIQLALDELRLVWDYHSSSGDASKTPRRLWSDGFRARGLSPEMPSRLPDPEPINYSDIDSFGCEPTYDPNLDDVVDKVELDDPTLFLLVESEFEQLAESYGADIPGDEHGLEAYRRLKTHFVSLRLP